MNPLVLALEVGGINHDTKPNQAATCCHTINIPWTPNIFTESESPIKLLLVGLIRGATHPPNPPMDGWMDGWMDGAVQESLLSSWPDVSLAMVMPSRAPTAFLSISI